MSRRFSRAKTRMPGKIGELVAGPCAGIDYLAAGWGGTGAAGPALAPVGAGPRPGPLAQRVFIASTCFLHPGDSSAECSPKQKPVRADPGFTSLQNFLTSSAQSA